MKRFRQFKAPQTAITEYEAHALIHLILANDWTMTSEKKLPAMRKAARNLISHVLDIDEEAPITPQRYCYLYVFEGGGVKTQSHGNTHPLGGSTQELALREAMDALGLPHYEITCHEFEDLSGAVCISVASEDFQEDPDLLGDRLTERAQAAALTVLVAHARYQTDVNDRPLHVEAVFPDGRHHVFSVMHSTWEALKSAGILPEDRVRCVGYPLDTHADSIDLSAEFRVKQVRIPPQLLPLS